MIFIYILAFAASVLVGTSVVPVRRTRFNISIVIFLAVAALGFIDLKLWGLLLLLGMIVIAFITLAFKMMVISGKISNAVDAQVAVRDYIDEQKEQSDGSPESLAKIEAMESESFIPGKADKIRNKHSKETFTVSTMLREVDFEHSGKEYTSTIESAIFAGTDSKNKPLMSIEFLGGTGKDVSSAHKIISKAVLNETPQGFDNDEWWINTMTSKGLDADSETNFSPMYGEDMTFVFVSKS